MKKQYITIVSIIITIALIGMVGIQLYWIKNAIKVKEANFDRSVNEAVSNVIYKLEKIDLARQIQTFNKQSEKFFYIIDSINNSIYKDFKKTISKNKHKQNNFNIYSSTSVQYGYTLREDISNVRSYDSDYVKISAPNKIYKGISATNKQYSLSVKPPKIEYEHNELSGEFEKFFNRTDIVSEIFENLFNVQHQQSIEKRIDLKVLDSLIQLELLNKGITTSYEFGIYNPSNTSLLVEKTGKYHNELMNKSMKFFLYPNDLFTNPHFLLIYFPNQKKFLLTQMWVMLSISAALMMIIIFLFFFTIITIIKQKKLSEMKNDFINNMTHEFKTPISTISLACEALNDNDIIKTKELSENYINIIRDENNRLGLLSERILQTALLEKGQLKLKLEQINLTDIIINVINNIKLQIENKGGQIITAFENRNVFIYGDKVHITNVFYNLIDNAGKYSTEKPVIKVKTSQNHSTVSVVIEDNGIGISKANQKRIFEPLFRVHTGNVHNVKGYGLGLAYVKMIVEKHHGKVSVESEMKKGSKFSIVFENNSLS